MIAATQAACETILAAFARPKYVFLVPGALLHKSVEGRSSPFPRRA